MSVDVGLFLSAFMTMFVILDPPGNLPVFMALTSRLSDRARKRAAAQANLIAFIILMSFGFFGFQLFNALGITKEALQLSGGLLLLLVALQLLTGQEQDPGDGGGSTSVAMVPLGMPLLAGPGSIVAFMLLVQRAGDSLIDVITVVLGLGTVILISWITMRFASRIMKVIGESGILLLTRLSGMLVAAIAAQLMINGVSSVVEQMGL